MQVGFNSQTATNEFLQLLTVQLQNQNPLEPVKQENFIGQLAQFSMLEGVENLNRNFQSMLKFQEISQGISLVGKTIEYLEADSGQLAEGQVSEFFVDQGNIFLMVDGKTIPVEYVAGMKATIQNDNAWV